MVPSYKDNEWQVVVRQTTSPVIHIRILEDEEWRDYWVPQDLANADYVQYQEWLAEGNEPRIIL